MIKESFKLVMLFETKFFEAECFEAGLRVKIDITELLSVEAAPSYHEQALL
jgi:hypothetical protein